MTSQNRQATEDWRAASHDYEVNLRAELEIIRLYKKIDALWIEHPEAMTHMQQEVMTVLHNKWTSSTVQ